MSPKASSIVQNMFFAKVLFIMLSLIFANWIAQPALADPGDITQEKIDQIDLILQQRLMQTGAKGVAVAIVQDGKIVFENGYGVINTSGAPVTEHTSFLLASVTKPFTALVTLQLIEEGMLEYDDLVIKHLPDFQTKQKSKSDQITIRHLLNQTSGLSSYSGNLHQNEIDNSPNALAQNVSRLKHSKLTAIPGQKFEYSNSNFHVLGHLIEQKLGQPIEITLQQRVWAKVGMKNTFAGLPTNPNTQPSERFRFWFNTALPFSKEVGRGMIPAGGASSSAHDMGLFLLELLNPMSKQIAPNIKLELWLNPSDVSEPAYRNGWFTTNTPIHHIYHDGSMAGATSLVAIFPETNSGMAIMSNTSIGMAFGNVRALEGAVLDIILEQPIRPATPELSYRVIYGAIILICLVLLILCVAQTRQIAKLRSTRSVHRVTGWPLLRKLGIAVVSFFIASAIVIGAPRLYDSSLSSLAEFLPDLGLLLKISAALATAYGLSHFVILSDNSIFKERDIADNGKTSITRN